MKLLILGDLHIRGKKPKHRTDDYISTQFEKLSYALNKGHSLGAEIIILPGDIFDSYGRDPYSVVYDFVDVIKKHNQKIYAVMGQHDLRYHNPHITNSPFHVLWRTGVLYLLNDIPVKIAKKVHLYGASWDEYVPSVKNESFLNILVTHKMIVQKKLWKDQKDFVYGNKFLEEHPEFDLVVSGDNHASFSNTIDDRYLVNCGSLCRMRSDQKDHQPCFYIYDTSTKEVKKHKIPVKDFNEVFDTKQIKEEKTKREKYKKYKDKIFSKSLRKDYNSELSFKNIIEKRMSSKKLSNGVRQFIERSYFGK